MDKEEKEYYNIQDFKVVINPDLKLSIKTPMDFWLVSSVSKLLWFGDKLLTIKAYDEKFAENYPKFRPFDEIEIHYNFVKPLITNYILYIHKHDETETLH